MAGHGTAGTRTLPAWPIAVAILLVLVSGWYVGSRGMAAALAPAAPARALAWHEGNAEALARINERESDPARKADRARRVLARQPLDGRAYRQLADVAEAGGDQARAQALHAIATRHSPRDRLSRAWLADHAHAQGRHDEALGHVDALMRMDAALREPVFERLALLSADAGFREALVTLLLSEPAWRAQFLGWWAARPGAAGGLEAVHRALAEAGASLVLAERAARVERLLREQRWDEARRTWAAGDRTRRTRPGAIVNGGFEHAPDGAFDWRIGEGTRHRTGIASDATGNRALRVELLGPGVQLGETAQLLTLAPGRHVVSLRTRLEALQAEHGLVAAVACTEAPDRPIGRSQPMRGSAPWRGVSFEVVVPGGCPAQWLSLGLASPALDRLATGVAWFDDFSVQSPARAMRAPAAVRVQPVTETAPSKAGFHDAVSRALARLDDRDDRDAPFGP